MKRLNVKQVTLVASLLEANNAQQPNGAIHVAVERQYVEDDATGENGEAVFTRDAGDVNITRADLVERARSLWADIAQHIANENATPVRATARPGRDVIEPVVVRTAAARTTRSR